MSDPEIKMCDVVPGEVAVAMFKWPWDGPGSEGAVSLKGQALLRQQEKNLKRQVAILPLPDQSAKLPLARDERTRLIAEKLAAESEREETAQRSSRLYEQVTELSAQLTTHKAQKEVADERIASLTSQLEEANAEAVTQAKRASTFAAEAEQANALLMAGPGKEAADEIASLKGQLETANARIIELSTQLEAATAPPADPNAPLA